jgi:hypothetical protein
MNTTLKMATFLAFDLMALNVMAVTANAATPRMPSFFARRDYQGIDQETSGFVQVADTNGDGIPDLISMAQGLVTVWLGNGDGTFQPFITGPSGYPALAPPVSFTVGDVNGDGKVDLISACTKGFGIAYGSIQVFLGNGDGTFQNPVVYSLNDNLTHLVLRDFDGDGIPDIAATGGSFGVWLLSGVGNGTFKFPVLTISLPDAFNIAAADFNKDGKLDLVVTTPAGFDVFLGNGNGTFRPPQAFSMPTGPVALAIGSLTPGAPPSIALNGARSNEVYLYPGNGAGDFSTPLTISLPGGHSDGLVFGDINGDGISDLVSTFLTGNYTEGFVYVALGEGGGAFARPVSYPIEGNGSLSNVVLADLRKNGLKDIVTGGFFGASVLLNVGKGYLEDGIWTAVTGGATCGATADFNGDGKPDLAVNTPSGISILLGTGKYLPPFSAGTSIALAGAGCPVTGDLNGDGIPDLLLPALGTGVAAGNATVVAYLGNGDGTFRLASTTPAPSEYYPYVVLADFNRDGKLDFATTGNLLALGNGDGTFQNPTAVVANPPSGLYSGIAVGDINNDGWSDIVLTSEQYQSDLTVLLNNHEGGFTQVSTSSNEGPLEQPILEDLNGDGNLDLVVGTAVAESSVYVYLGNGTGTFTSPTTLQGLTDAESGIYSVADVNGDGIPDILMSGLTSIDVFLGEGGGTYATPFLIGTGPSPGGLLVENLHGQSPKAGVPDIVVPDTSGGVMVLLNLTP